MTRLPGNRLSTRPGEDSGANSRGIWLAAVLLLAGTAGGLSLIDGDTRRWVQSVGLRGDLQRTIRLLEIFAHGTGLVVTLALIWTLGPDLRRRLPRLLAAYGLAGLTVNLIKLVFPRLRPSADPTASLPSGWGNWEHFSQSFPSGHSAAAVALALSLAILLPRGRAVFLALAGLACLQRVMFDAHWPSDVAAGAAIGVAAVALVYRSPWADRLFARFENPPLASSSRQESGVASPESTESLPQPVRRPAE